MVKAAYVSYGPIQATKKGKGTDVHQPLDERQVLNSTGGYVYQLTDFARLNRFLILGSDAPTFYVSAQQLTADNASCVTRCMEHDPIKTVQTILDISMSGRAPKNDPALFALALCASTPTVRNRSIALDQLPNVARTLSHLYSFISYLSTMRGINGRQIRTALANWFNVRTDEELVYQLVKYRERGGYTARDLLRFSHAAPLGEPKDMAFAWAVGKLELPDEEPEHDDPLRMIWAFEQAKSIKDDADGKRLLIKLIEEYGLTREMVPTWFLKDKDVWRSLLQKMPIGAMLRNIRNMSEVGLLLPFSDAATVVVNRLTDEKRIKNGRIHPLNVLVAIKAYERRGGGQVLQVVDALETALELGFTWIPKTGKRWMLGLDVSGSMATDNIAGVSGVTPAEASAVMAMVTARTEDNYYIFGYADSFRNLHITKNDSFRTVMEMTTRQNFGGTNLAIPFTHAVRERIEADVFVSYTDNEVNMGPHVPIALRRYREKMALPDTRSIVVGMTATDFSIADPLDPLCLDVVGFDTDTPSIMGYFAMGEI